MAAPPRAAKTRGDGNTIANVTPPVTIANESTVFPNTLSFFLLMSLFMLPSVLLMASLSFRISSSDRLGYDIFYLINKMILMLGYVLAGAIIYETLRKDETVE